MIDVRRAATHNLQQVSLQLHPAQWTVLTGPSGAGKSSLAWDTLYREAWRRYALVSGREASQERPPMASLTGLPPAVGLPQRGRSGRWGETALSLAGLAEPLEEIGRALGERRCGAGGAAAPVADRAGWVRRLMALPEGTPLTVLAPLSVPEGSGAKRVLEEAARQGFVRARVDGQLLLIEEVPPLDARVKHRVEVVIDRLKAAPDRQGRLEEAITVGLRVGRLVVSVLAGTQEGTLSLRPHCQGCGAFWPPVEPGFLATPEAAHWRLGGRPLSAWAGATLAELSAWSAALVPAGGAAAAAAAWEEWERRLRLAASLHLGAIRASDRAASLSSGAWARLRLVDLAARPLEGVLIVLDEPATGLHPREVPGLVGVLRGLARAGCYLLVVEHDPAVIAAADREIRFGPGAGPDGGRVVYDGPPQAAPSWAEPVWAASKLSTLARGEPLSVRPGEWVAVVGESATLAVPRIEGFSRVVTAAHGPAAVARRSTVASLLGLATPLRERLAATTAAKVDGRDAAWFRLDAPQTRAGGVRCEACAGLGMRRARFGVSMPCGACGGSGYGPEAAAYRLWERSLPELMALPLTALAAIAGRQPRIGRPLAQAIALGVGYLPLGQPGAGLSGGEVWRLQLARALSGVGALSGATVGARPLEGTLYAVELPTAGLSAGDVAGMIGALHALTAAGAALVTVDNHPLLAAAADRGVEVVG